MRAALSTIFISFRRLSRLSKIAAATGAAATFALALTAAALTTSVLFAQTPTPTPAPAQSPTQPQKPTPKPTTPGAPTTPQIATSPEVQAPSSKHYPILVIAHGTEPFWSLRLGMKGPERLDRVGYPEMALDPADIIPDDSGGAWTYRAKDSAANADVTVKLARDPCSDSMSETKYTFTVVIEQSELGILKGCGQSEPDKFPEFRKKNRLDDTEPLDTTPAGKDKDKDKDKKSVLDPITKFSPPVAIAYIDATGKIIVSHGQLKKTAAPSGQEPALSHDGKKLLYTRSDSKTGPERSIVLYDFDSGRSRDLVTGNAREAFWSPDDSRVAFLKFDTAGNQWQLWTLPLNAPEKAAAVAPQNFDALHGWVSPTTLLVTDKQNAYWLGDDGKPQQTVPLKDIYGSTFDVMSSDTIRSHPLNPDLLLVSAYYLNTPPGAPTDSVSLNSTFFLYEVRGKRRVILGPTDSFSRDAEWSRDGLQIYFTRGVPGKIPLAINRIFWDGSVLRRYLPGSNLVIGK